MPRVFRLLRQQNLSLMVILLFCACLVCLVTTARPAHAQMGSQTNCSALLGFPLICVKNESAFPIMGIQTTSSMSLGSNWIAVPGGPIPPGGLAIVKFPPWSGDYQNVFVKTMEGRTRMFPHQNVRWLTSLVIGREGW
jgi:hypothetical protein